jgi:parvulin-like peptidyl-prolyl isomerase
VRETIANDFKTKATSQLERLAVRQITFAKVAKAFTAAASRKQGGKDDLLMLPEQFESSRLAGTNPPL